ncbi:mechanosensitive ion channel family protein [Methanobrevibacter sp. DSM 116169]|uniref:mechanosensitive ion channel family protein n=1 Tax=Methanobrevibacter sp. DSM 116169 TaxID=3242727 RepID=UPI0038FCD0ED
MEIITIDNLVYQLLFTVITIAITIILVKAIKFICNKMESKSNLNITLVDLISDLITYIIYIAALIAIFDIFGINLTSIFVSIGIAGITLGFAAKDIISNVVSGIFLISDNNVKIGDTIQVDSIKGKVKKISFRTTTIVDNSGLESVIPNSILSNKTYTKFNKYEDLRVDLIATIPLENNIEVFKEKILNKINNINEISKKKNPNIFSQKITEEGIIVKISLWVNDPSKIDSIKLQVTNDVSSLINNYRNDYNE